MKKYKFLKGLIVKINDIPVKLLENVIIETNTDLKRINNSYYHLVEEDGKCDPSLNIEEIEE